MNSSTNDIGRLGRWSLAGSVISAAMGFAFTFVVTRGFGDVGAGVIFQAVGVFSIALGLSKLGMDSVSLYLIPRLMSDRSSTVGAAMRWILLLAGAGSIIGGLAVWGYSLVVAAEADLQGQLPEALWYVAWFVPAGVLAQVALAMLRAMGGIRAYTALGSVLLPTVRPLLALLAMGLALSPAVAALLWAVPLPVVAGLAAAVLLRRFGQYSMKLRGNQIDMPLDRGRMVRFAIPRTLAAGLEQLGQWLDVIVVGAVAGLAAAGVYGGVMRVVLAGLLVDNALRTVVSPIYSRLLHERAFEELRSLFSRATVGLVVASNAIYLTLAVHAATVMGWLGTEFTGGTWALVIIAAAASLTMTAGNVHSLLLMSGHSGWAAINKALSLTLSVGLMLWWLPIIGLWGAAAAKAVGLIADATLAAVQVRRFTGLNVWQWQVWRVWLISAVLVVLPQLLIVIDFGASGPSLRFTTTGEQLVALAAGVTVSGLLLLLWARRDESLRQAAKLLRR